jgi:glycosyltransferase involved in cell wall biosynthesis
MHITFVIQDLYRLGAQYVTSLIMSGLVRRGHKVDLILSGFHEKTARERPDLIPFPIPQEVVVYNLQHEKASRNILPIAAYLRARHPDIIVPIGTYVLPAAIALWLTGSTAKLVPVEHASGIGVKDNHGYFKDGNVNYKPSIGRRLIISILTALFGKRTNHVIAVSNGVKDALVKTMRLDSRAITVIYNPVVDETFFQKKSQPASHPWLIDKQLPVIVAAGAHVPFKGYDVLLNAFATVTRRKRCRLILFGEGPKQADLKALACKLGLAELVSFPGYTTNLPAELKCADCFVVSSYVESFSIVLVEALACGIPVVATNCPSGPPEILRGGQYGSLVETGNASDLAEGILAILDGQGKIPPPESWRRYELDTVTLQYEDLFGRILRS